MVNYSSSLARRTGSAHLPSSGSGFFETMKTIPARLFSERARTPVMFGGLGSMGAGWYGNEPEAKAGGGATMHSNLFGFGSAHEEADYLNGFTYNNTAGMHLGIAAVYFLTR